MGFKFNKSPFTYFITKSGPTCRRLLVSVMLPWALRLTNNIHNTKFIHIKAMVLTT